MNTGTNNRKTSTFISNSMLQVVPLSNSPIQWEMESSAEINWEMQGSADINIVVHKPVKTPSFRKANSVLVLSIPRGSEIGPWHLKSVLLVQISRSRRESVATTWLEGVAEYGVGKGDDEAILDLVVSLGEYRDSLEKRKGKLGDSARKELDRLRKLIRTSSG